MLYCHVKKVRLYIMTVKMYKSSQANSKLEWKSLAGVSSSRAYNEPSRRLQVPYDFCISVPIPCLYLQWVSCLAECLQCESVGVFNQKKALVGAFSLIAKACLKLYLPVPRLWALVPAQDYNLVLAAAAGWREGDSNQLKLVSASQSNNKLRMEIRLW